MKSRIFNPITMFILALFVTASVSSAFAQEATRTADTKATTGTSATSTKEKTANDQEFKKSNGDKMAKFDEEYSKLKQKEATTKDPAMKSDLDNMLSKMDATKADMSRYEANKDNMTEEQRQQAQANIKSQMNDIKQMHDAAHQKYGKGDKQGANQGDKSSKQNVNKSAKTGTTSTSTDTQVKEANKQNVQKEGKTEKKSKTTTEGDNPK